MTLANWIALGCTVVPLTLAAVVWLVRLEGKVSTQSVRIVNLEQLAKTHEDTKIEVVRLQEQIKNLSNMIERYFKDGV